MQIVGRAMAGESTSHLAEAFGMTENAIHTVLSNAQKRGYVISYSGKIGVSRKGLNHIIVGADLAAALDRYAEPFNVTRSTFAQWLLTAAIERDLVAVLLEDHQ
ncbi:MAG: hypothetical protein AAGM84_05460 [Pseudomonadota bacterium]